MSVRPPTAQRLRVSVCICTYRRPHLAHCLESVAAQKLDDRVAIRIAVVDNCPDRSARSIVAAAIERTGRPITYLVEPTRNLATVRNAALDAADGDLVALIDDDEIAAPDWLAALIDCRDRYDADAVIGPVYSRYSSSCPDWIRRGNLISRPLAVSGRPLRVGHAGNALLHRRLLNRSEARFDARFGQTGGEDTDFFWRLSRAGARVVACRAGVAYESIDPARENLDYLFRENRRIGQVFCRVIWPNLSLIERSWAFALVVMKVVVFAIGSAVNAPFGRHRSIWWRLRLACNVEKIRYLVTPQELVRPYGG